MTIRTLAAPVSPAPRSSRAWDNTLAVLFLAAAGYGFYRLVNPRKRSYF